MQPINSIPFSKEYPAPARMGDTINVIPPRVIPPDLSEMSLYELDRDLMMLLDALPDPEDGEPSPELLASIDQYLSAGASKCDRTAEVIKSHEARIEKMKVERKRLSEREARLERQIEILESRIMNFMRSKGIKKLEGDLNTLKIAKNPDIVVFTDELKTGALVPDEYKTYTIEAPAVWWKELNLAFNMLHGHPIGNALPYAQHPEVKVKDTKISKTDIKKDIEAGSIVDGADLEINRVRLDVK